MRVCCCYEVSRAETDWRSVLSISYFMRIETVVVEMFSRMWDFATSDISSLVPDGMIRS